MVFEVCEVCEACVACGDTGYSCKLLTQSTALLVLNENSLDVRFSLLYFIA